MRGIDLEALLRTASHQISMMNGETTQPLNLEARTNFSELHSTLVLKHGVASNTDLDATAGILKLKGNGTFDLNSNAIDYTIQASVNPKVPELKGLSGLSLPIKLAGLLNAPEYHIDYASLKEQILVRQKAMAEARIIAAEAAAKQKKQALEKAAADKKAATLAAEKRPPPRLQQPKSREAPR